MLSTPSEISAFMAFNVFNYFSLSGVYINLFATSTFRVLGPEAIFSRSSDFFPGVLGRDCLVFLKALFPAILFGNADAEFDEGMGKPEDPSPKFAMVSCTLSFLFTCNRVTRSCVCCFTLFCCLPCLFSSLCFSFFLFGEPSPSAFVLFRSFSFACFASFFFFPELSIFTISFVVFLVCLFLFCLFFFPPPLHHTVKWLVFTIRIS